MKIYSLISPYFEKINQDFHINHHVEHTVEKLRTNRHKNPTKIKPTTWEKNVSKCWIAKEKKSTLKLHRNCEKLNRSVKYRQNVQNFEMAFLEDLLQILKMGQKLRTLHILGRIPITYGQNNPFWQRSKTISQYYIWTIYETEIQEELKTLFKTLGVSTKSIQDSTKIKVGKWRKNSTNNQYNLRKNNAHLNCYVFLCFVYITLHSACSTILHNY